MNLGNLRFRRKVWKKRWSLLLGIFLALPLSATFKAFFPYYNFAFGAKAMSMGNAFTAVADDLSAIFWNPAGLADFSLPMVTGNFRSDRLTGTTDIQEYAFSGTSQARSTDLESSLKNIDFLSISVPALFWNVKWNFALSYIRYIPYNFEGWRRDETISTGNNNEIKREVLAFSGESGIDALGFSIAVDFSEYFSVGVTLQYFFNSGRMLQRFESADLQYDLELTEELNGQNIIIGGLFKPDKFFSLGFVFQSGFSDSFNIESRYSGNNEPEVMENSFNCQVRIPPRFGLGITIRPQESWQLAYDFSKVLWKTGTIRGLDDLDTEYPFPVRDDFPIDQLDNLNHRLGMEFDIKVKELTFHIRGGLFWERQLFEDAENRKVWVKGFSLGLGIKIFPRLVMDLAYMKQTASWKENGYFDPQLLVEDHYRNHIFACSLTYWFAREKNK
jgi:long-chain fatty acid transport protein